MSYYCCSGSYTNIWYSIALLKCSCYQLVTLSCDLCNLLQISEPPALFNCPGLLLLQWVVNTNIWYSIAFRQSVSCYRSSYSLLTFELVTISEPPALILIFLGYYCCEVKCNIWVVFTIVKVFCYFSQLPLCNLLQISEPPAVILIPSGYYCCSE
jgi:hypothetical protein